MLEKKTLRKADIITSLLIVLFGLWVVYQAAQMPMKDSYGGVQNVWYVSPALFPLFVGSMLALIGLVLLGIAMRETGFSAGLEWLAGSFKRNEAGQLLSDSTQRFAAIALIMIIYVYLFIPRIDFYISTLLFITSFIMMFYLDHMTILRNLLLTYCLGALGLLILFGAGFSPGEGSLPYLADLLSTALLVLVTALSWIWTRGDASQARRFRTGLLVAFIAPTFLVPVFKYFLLVPMPYEGFFIEIMEYLRYGPE
jgi:hypothetical protein